LPYGNDNIVLSRGKAEITKQQMKRVRKSARKYCD